MIKKLSKTFTNITKKLITQSKSENIIEVDKNNKILGPISKHEAHLKTTISQNRLHRAFSLFLFNSQNALLLQKRSKHKATFPSLWTNSVCSHPLYNDQEKNEQNNIGLKKAAKRRLKFELNIEHENLEDFKVIDQYVYQALDFNEFGEFEVDFMIFLKIDVGDFGVNEEEVDAVRWVPETELRKLLRDSGERREVYTPWFGPALEKVLRVLDREPQFLK